ncbi:MAG: C69 family dipeptidase [Sphingobacterium sp.]|nr:C69 family dipeptidase [Sphingobacterium sp.]
MGELGEKYGYGHTDTGEMLAVADPNEVWTVRDHARRPAVDARERQARRGLVRPARPRRPRRRLRRTSRASARSTSRSPTISWPRRTSSSWPIDMKFFDPKAGKPFNWKKAYNPTDVSAANTDGARVRLWRFLTLVAPSQKFSPETLNEDLPFSVKPDKKLSVRDVMWHDPGQDRGHALLAGPGHPGRAVPEPQLPALRLRARGQALQHAPRHRRQPGRVRHRHPEPGLAAGSRRRSRLAGLGRPGHVLLHAPLRGGHGPDPALVRDRRPLGPSTGTRPAGPSTTSISTPRSPTTWPSRTSGPPRRTYEDPAVERTRCDRQGRPGPLQEGPGARGRQFLTDYCLANVDRVLAAWWQLGDDLLVKYNHMWVYDKATRKRGPLKFPDWWLKLLVEYNQLNPQPATKK